MFYLYIQNPILRFLRNRFLRRGHFTGVKPFQDEDQPDGVVRGQAGNRQQPDAGEPVERYEVDKGVYGADEDVEDADYKGRVKVDPLVVGEAVEDSRDAGNVEATPDDRPDAVAGVGAPPKGTKDIDDPGQNEADTNIPYENKTHVRAMQCFQSMYIPDTIDNIHTEAELLDARDLAQKSSIRKHCSAPCH